MVLKVLTEFFEKLNSENISYSHWKSNFFIEKSMNGETDLDILVNRKDTEKFLSIVYQYGFKHIIPEKHKMYIGIDNFAGFDKDTQKIIHLHVYFKMISGKHLLKDFNLPFEKNHLESSKPHPKLKIKIPSIESEFIVLSCRILVKIRLMKHIIKLGSPFPKHLNDEIDNFIRVIDKKKLNVEINKIENIQLKKAIKEFISLCEKKKVSRIKLISLSSKVKKELKEFRRYNFIEKNYLYIYRKFLALLSKNDRNKRRMIMSKSGKVFAFVGVPGSGKSSTAHEIKSWLNVYLGVKKYYLGIPQKTIPERLGLLIFIPINQPFKLLNKIKNKNNIFFRIYSYIYDIALCIRWYGVALSSYKLYKQALFDAFNGQLVIIDRYPIKELNESMKKNPVEAPRISFMSINKNWKLVKYFEKKEFYLYQKIANNKDVTLFWLDVDSKVSAKRGRPINNVEFQNKYFKNIKADSSTKIRINANRPHEETKAEIKKIIWSQI